jgi:molybdate transport system substrate-binding protein
MPSAIDTAAVNVFSGGAMRRFMVEALPLFERESGRKVIVRFDPTRVLKQEIMAGAAFDVALMPRPAMAELAQMGRIAATTLTDVARSAVGLVVRAGAPRPDIATVDAFKALLRGAGSIAYSKGPSGVRVGEIIDGLGLGEAMAPKTRFAVGRPVAELVANGEAEIGMQQIIEILPVPGAELVGPLPSALDSTIIYTAGLSGGPAAGGGAAAARAVVAFLTSAAAARIIRSKGIEPG